jgi:hypothetical protein
VTTFRESHVTVVTGTATIHSYMFLRSHCIQRCTVLARGIGQQPHDVGQTGPSRSAPRPQLQQQQRVLREEDLLVRDGSYDMLQCSEVFGVEDWEGSPQGKRGDVVMSHVEHLSMTTATMPCSIEDMLTG